MDKRDMLDEYFSLSFTETGDVDSLPMILKGYTPNLDRLPHFLLCLATRVGPPCYRKLELTVQVDWTNEKKCFESTLRELAFFYSPRPFAIDAQYPPLAHTPQDGEDGHGEAEMETGTATQATTGMDVQPDGSLPTAEEVAHQEWQLEHVLMPSFRKTTVWPKRVGEGDGVRRVADLPELFRVFERC
jgi:DNA mismatch repair protein MLH1